MTEISKNIALATHHAINYKSLADITFANKQAYCLKYGYTAYDDALPKHYPSIGFEKIKFVEKVLHNHDYVWWTGCDSLVTNFKIDIADVIKQVDLNYHVIIATDVNGINADSFIVKNSAEGHAFLNLVHHFEPQYKNHFWFEQQVIIDLYPQFTNIIKIIPQRLINSYDYKLYPQHPPTDKFGNPGQWEEGDLLIHWPGLGLQKRLELAAHYLPLVKY